MFKNTLIAFATCNIFAAAVSAQTTPPEQDRVETPRGVAMGPGALGNATSTSALAYNPAGMSATSVYHVEGGAAYIPDAGRFVLSSSVVDSTRKIAAGLAFRGLLSAEDESYSGMDGQGALSIALAESISVGLTGRYVSLSYDDSQTPADGDDTALRGFTMGASIHASPIPQLHISAVAMNFIDLESPLAPLTLGGGAAVVIADVFTLSMDALADMTTFEQPELTIGGAAEYFGETFALRAGYMYDTGRHRHSVTGGIAYIQSTVGIDASVRVNDDGETTVIAAVRYFVL